MPSDHANDAAVVAAGYQKTMTDRGAGFSPASERWLVRYEKPVIGIQGYSGGLLRGEGRADTQANAEAQALAAINGIRQVRYGRDAANVNKGPSGSTLTTDLH